MRFVLMAALVACSAATVAAAEPQVFTGAGETPVTRDENAVRALAEESAKEDLVRALVRQTLGAERLGEVPPDMQHRLATRIRNEMIVDRSAQRVGQTYRVTLSARIDLAWFQSQLDNEGVETSADRAGGDRQPIFVMVDEDVGVARDYQKPASIVTEYDHSIGSDYRDKSSAAYSERAASGKVLNGTTGSSANFAGAAGYSGDGGSAAMRANGSAASATTVHSAAAANHSVAAVAKTDVTASDHDNVHFYQNITYQTSSTTTAAKAGRAALGEALQSYGVTMASSDIELASYFKTAPPTYAALLTSPQFKPFVTSLAQRKVAPFFLGATLTVRYGAKDAATGQELCTGELAATAYATADSLQIAAAQPNGAATGLTAEACGATLAHTLAAQAASSMGPQIQTYWRKQLRNQARVVAAADAARDYTLTVRAANLTMDMQADLLDAIAATPGVEKHVFLGQSGNQVSFQIHYAGGLPLQMALYQRLRSRPGFAQMQPTTDGQSVVLCVSACGAP